VRPAFAAVLRCPRCGDGLAAEAFQTSDDEIVEGVLRSGCGGRFPVIGGVPRILPEDAAATLSKAHPAFFERHPELAPGSGPGGTSTSLRTLRAFGDEWQRFPELLKVHEGIFRWYFEGPKPVAWEGLRVLDAGCGMGRWLHFAREARADIVGMDVSGAIDVVASREKADVVQADLRFPPLPESSFDLVYSLGVLHHLEDPVAGLRALARLVRPGGEIRIYIYRSLRDESLVRRLVLSAVTLLRSLTTRLPFWALHAFSWLVAVVATALFILPRRALRGTALGDRLTRGLPLVHYADVPFGMLVAEQFDRFGAPIEGRFTREEIEGWMRSVGLEVVTTLPGLGWRAIGRKPL
jgi:SAM-dependent methyltransferase